MATNVMQCPLCDSPSPSFKLYVSDLRLVHSKDPLFNLMCGVDGCREVFRAFSAFSSHVYRHHRAAISTGIATEPQQLSLECETSCQTPGPSFQDECVDNALLEDMQSELTADRTDAISTHPPDCETVTAAKFLLQLREGRQISQTAILDVTAGCKSLCKQAVDVIREGVKEKLASAAINCESIPGLAEVLNYDPDPFERIDTNYHFEKSCTDDLGYLGPTEISFGEPYYVNQFSGRKRRKVSKSDKFCYVPILQSLKNLLELEDFQAEVLNLHTQGSENYLGDFCDGSFFKSHTLFSSDPLALQVIAYYDELEVVNPLGSYVKKHKLGCLFFFLGNIRPQYRSTFKAIHLIAVAECQDIVTYGIDTFMTPFIEDMKTLYCDGITISVGGVERTLHGALVAFLADTLAAHTVGGFKGSMPFALRVCRSCMVTTSQIKECLLESSCVLRTPESHFEQCSLLVGPLRDHYSTSYGINRLSKLEEIPGFSVIEGLPHDIMHDLFEGVVAYELKLLLCHCVRKKYFTIDMVNENWDFSSNKPVPIGSKILTSPTAKIRQSASQMMTLCQELPLLIADVIPHDDQNWHSFLVLLKICSIAVSPLCTQDTVAYLTVLIEENLYLFKHLYTESNMIPKQHYMVHYPSQIQRLGPLINSWSMGQEAKLCFIKRAARCSNFKNVCKTVAKNINFGFVIKFSQIHIC